MDTVAEFKVPYDFTDPSRKTKLPNDLEEISGISLYGKNDVIACHNDEKGKIYLFDLEKEKIVDEIKFDKDGDYEDIAIVDDVAYVVRSDGKIYEVRKLKAKKNKVEEYKTSLSQKNDVEGLCYEPKINALLLACKASPNAGSTKFKDARAVYAFDLKKKELLEEPYLVIAIDDIKDTIETSAYEEFSKRLAKNISSAGDPSFQPSAIDIHPKTGNIYMLSSVGKKIVVLNNTKEIVAVIPINKKIFTQPEGICFKENGDMLISNEGKGGKANILEFKYKGDA